MKIETIELMQSVFNERSHALQAIVVMNKKRL